MADVSYGDTLRSEPSLSWSAIIAGSAITVATSVFLTLLAAGFGYNLAEGAIASQQSLEGFTPELGAAAVAIQVISVALGAYMAGRLRHVWSLAHPDEAHFRDTAQGLIVWAVSTVIGLALAVLVIAPYAEHVAALTVAAIPPPDPARAAQIATQSAFFAAVGMVLSAFIAAVAARIGGLQTEHMRLKGR